MAELIIQIEKIKDNIRYLSEYFEKHNIHWSLITKVFSGDKEFLENILTEDVISKIGSVGDSRLTSLKNLKAVNSQLKTIYIKPPAKMYADEIIKYADISLNSSFSTIMALNVAAKKANKTHQIIIMIELGDLREGILGEHLMAFYKKIFELPNIKISGIGANLNCLSGVMPSKDKLIQLSLYEQLIEAKFGKKIDFVSGGSSVMIPLLLSKQIPKGVNHFRIGETLFFGVDLFTNNTIPKMKNDVFLLYAEIIEITEKSIVPYGDLEENPSGELLEINPEDYGKNHSRGILDIGLLDISKTEFLIPEDNEITFIGASSDMLVIDLSNTTKKYKVGDLVSFKMKYMGALLIMNSEYIEKKLI